MTYTDEEIITLLTERGEIPPAYVLEVTKNQFMVRCPYCGGKHWHGRGGGLDHRAAHCSDNIVDTSKGYFIRVYDPYEELQALTPGTTFKTTGPHK